jgi:UDP-N-acetylmuramoylalanine-D-glutamate ligase
LVQAAAQDQQVTALTEIEEQILLHWVLQPLAAAQVQVIIHQTAILHKLVVQEAAALDLVMLAVFVQALQGLQVKDIVAVMEYTGLEHRLEHIMQVAVVAELANLDIIVQETGQLAEQIIRKHGMYL